MSKANKLTFSITSARPALPAKVSNKVKPPQKRGAVTVHVVNSVSEPVERPTEPYDEIAQKKRDAAARVREKAARVAAEARAREEALNKDVEVARQAREAANSQRNERSRAAEVSAAKPRRSAAEVKAQAKARANAREKVEPVVPVAPVSAPSAQAEIAPAPLQEEEASLSVDASAQVDTPQNVLAPQGIAPAATKRAELLVRFAALSGATALASDLIEGFHDKTGTDLAPETLVSALRSTGLEARVESAGDLQPKLWPALAYMTSGQVIMVTGQEGDTLHVHDRTQPDNTAEVATADFLPYFTGTVIRAGKTLETIAATHLPQAQSGHWFWSQFKPLRKQIAEIALGSLVANMLAVAVALFSLQVYDRVIPHQSQSTLWVLALGVGVAIVFEAMLKLARARLMDGAGRQIEMRVQGLLMDRILGMRSDARSGGASGLFSAMREFGSVREFFTSATIGTVADIPFILLFLALVASIAGPVVAFLLVGAVLMVIPGYFLQKRMMRLTKETQGAAARSGRLLQEVIYDLDTVKSQRGEARVRRIWDELNMLSALKSSEQRKIASGLTFWAQAVQQLTYICAVVAGTYLVFAGEFTVGTIIATGILTSRTLAPLAQLSGTMARWTNVKAALDGLDQIVTSPQDSDPTRSYLRREVLRGDYGLREMQFRYDEEGAPSLDIPALDIKAGQKVALLGANGSGKSTFLKVLAGLYHPARGRVMLDGAELGQLDMRDLRRNIGYLGQDVRLFAASLRENLDLGGMGHSDDDLYAALDFAGLGTYVRSHPRGLDIEIRDGGEGLSVGQRQSIGWARLWLQNPSICLLDEPTASLDTALEAKLVKRMADWLAPRTAIIATHRMPIVALTNRTMVFKGGRLVVDGPTDQVTAHLARANGGAE